MRLRKIALNDFKGFPGMYEFDLSVDCKNLLIYGENGSGKSSLYAGIRSFLEVSGSSSKIVEQQHIQVANPQPFVSLEIEGFDATNSRLPESGVYLWDAQGSSPNGEATFIACALASPWLDYKRLLATHFTHIGDDQVDLFDLLVKQILADSVNPTSRRAFRVENDRLEQLSAEIVDRIFRQLPDKVVKRAATGKAQPVEDDPIMDASLRELSQTLGDFNSGLTARCAEIEKKSNTLLREFDSHLRTKLKVIPGHLTDRDFYVRPRILLSAVLHGRTAPRHHQWLNEARLSAIAISLFLASVLTLPEPSLKLLLLDDVLVGLDLGNRYPVVRILERHFSKWQVIILTHDYVWYDMIRLGLSDKKWAIYEMFRRTDVDAGFDRPLLVPYGAGPEAMLLRAETHLANHDARAAAVYARGGFEAWVKGRADKKNLNVAYSKDPRQPKVDSIWTAVQTSCIDATGAIPAAKQALINNLNAARKVVLNPWSHGSGAPVTEPEVQAAINAVRALFNL